WFHPEGMPALRVQILADQAPLLSGQSTLTAGTAEVSHSLTWSGNAQWARTPAEPWLLAWLNQWLPQPLPEDRARALEQAQLQLDWNLSLPRRFGLEGWRELATGELRLKGE